MTTQKQRLERGIWPDNAVLLVGYRDEAGTDVEWNKKVNWTTSVLWYWLEGGYARLAVGTKWVEREGRHALVCYPMGQGLIPHLGGDDEPLDPAILIYEVKDFDSTALNLAILEKSDKDARRLAKLVSDIDTLIRDYRSGK